MASWMRSYTPSKISGTGTSPQSIGPTSRVRPAQYREEHRPLFVEVWNSLGLGETA